MFYHVWLCGQWASLQRYQVPPYKGNSCVCIWGLFFCLFLLKAVGSNTICITCQHISQWCQNYTAKEKKRLQLISFGEGRRWGELNYKTPVTCCGNLICDEIPCLSMNAYFGGILSGTGSEPIRHRGYVSSTSSLWSPLCRPSVQLPDMHIGMLHAYVNTECSHTKCMDIISKALLNFWLI